MYKVNPSRYKELASGPLVRFPAPPSYSRVDIETRLSKVLNREVHRPIHWSFLDWSGKCTCKSCSALHI